MAAGVSCRKCKGSGGPRYRSDPMTKDSNDTLGSVPPAPPRHQTYEPPAGPGRTSPTALGGHLPRGLGFRARARARDGVERAGGLGWTGRPSPDVLRDPRREASARLEARQAGANLGCQSPTLAPRPLRASSPPRARTDPLGERVPPTVPRAPRERPAGPSRRRGVRRGSGRAPRAAAPRSSRRGPPRARVGPGRGPGAGVIDRRGSRPHLGPRALIGCGLTSPRRLRARRARGAAAGGGALATPAPKSFPISRALCSNYWGRRCPS